MVFKYENMDGIVYKGSVKQGWFSRGSTAAKVSEPLVRFIPLL